MDKLKLSKRVVQDLKVKTVVRPRTHGFSKLLRKLSGVLR